MEPSLLVPDLLLEVLDPRLEVATDEIRPPP
jgi:hypothetical protein